MPGESKTAMPTRAEWIVAVASGLLIIGALGLVLEEAVTEPDTPPDIQIVVGELSRIRGGYAVQFEARNVGHATAAGLTIEGTLKRDSVTVETSSLTMSFVPSKAVRRAGLFFERDPRLYRLEIRPKGYDVP